MHTPHNDKGDILYLFSKGVGIKDSNETEVLAVFEALRIFSHSFQGRLIVESDNFNAVCQFHG